MLVPLGLNFRRMLWTFVLLVLIASGLIWLIVQTPKGLGKLPGVFWIVIGAFNILLHRRIGRQTYNWARSMPPFVAKLWAHCGEQGTQILFMGIGVVLLLAGFALIAKESL